MDLSVTLHKSIRQRNKDEIVTDGLETGTVQVRMDEESARIKGVQKNALVMSMGISSAFAASITISRDDSYDGTGDGNVYKYYKVFSASYESNTSTGGGSNAGAPGDVTASATAAAYTATSAVAAKLGSWATPVYYTAEDTIPEGKQVGDLKSGGWTRAEGNLWFDLTPIAGTETFSVTWANSSDTAETVQAAAAWLIANEAYEAGPIALTANDTGWASGTIDAGYYLVEGATGKNLVAATTDVTIKEKNTYPPQDKKQADEDNAEMTNDDKNVAVGDVLDYEVTVTIPATAKVGDQILVWDKPTTGLTYNNDVAVKTNEGAATVAAATPESGQAWAQLITVTAGSQGKDVVFKFSMTVNSTALTTTKENESGLKYGREGDWKYESEPDRVEFKTYYAGIHKIDGTTKEDLAGVKFTLKEAGTEFKVSKPEGKDYYIPDANGSSEVVTDSKGNIVIRGLDSDKAYTLTETETLPGYNKLAEDVTLSLSLDSVTVTVTPAATEGGTPTTTTESSFDEATAAEGFEWAKVENNKGTVLPSTGGIGTTIFYVVGSILVVAAGVLLITKKRMSREG